MSTRPAVPGDDTAIIEISGVQARPGGRVRLRFTPVGLSIADDPPPPGRLERFFGVGPMLFALCTMVLQAWPWAFVLDGDPSPATGVLAAVPALLALLYFLAGSLFHQRHKLIGMALFSLLMFGLILLLPLLLFLLCFRRFRRWAFGGRDARNNAGGERLIATGGIGQGRVLHHHGGAVTVALRLTDGTDVGYTAAEGDGVRLVHGFRLLLGERLHEEPAPAYGPR